MPDVALHLRALLGLVLVGLAQRLDVDRRAVQGRRDRAGEKRAVVVGVVPRQAAFVERVLPEALHELDRVQGLLGLENRLPLLVDLLAAEGPQIGIAEGRCVAEGVAERLAERAALGFQLLAGVVVLLPGLRKRAVADFIEPRFAVRDLRADDRPGHGQGLLALGRVGAAQAVIALLRLANGFGYVGDVRHPGRVDVRMVVERHDKVRTGARLDRRRDARLQVVAVDGLEVDLHPERLHGFRQHRLAQQLVRCRDEVVPLQPMHGRLLREHRRLVRCEDPREPGARSLQEFASIELSHVVSPSLRAYHCTTSSGRESTEKWPGCR